MKNLSSLAALTGKKLNGPDGPIPGAFVADSRLISPGDAFVAFRGENQDGHVFIPRAVERGASLILCEDDRNVPEGVSSILLSDCYREVPLLASRRLALEKGIDFIALTGSVGKTTTREILRRCLQTSFSVHSAGHSYNTLVGCGLSILSLPEKTDILLLEMGTNHPGEIEEMVTFFPPSLAVITEVAPAHLEGLISLEGVLEAKFEITRSRRLEVFFYNGDNNALTERAADLPSEIRKFSVGFGRGDFSVGSPEFQFSQGEPRLTFDFSYPGGSLYTSTRLFGRHSAYPLGFALAVSFYCGASREKVLNEIETIKTLRGRGRMITLDSGALLIDDAYNANPSSLTAALTETAEIPALRRLAVVGEMRELGPQGPEYHRRLLPLFDSFDHVWLTGDLWKDLFAEGEFPSSLEYISHIPDLAKQLSEDLREGDVLLVKGSNGNRLDRIVDALTGEEELS
ncbi:MAG: UDP-N-acetylmuramoyl-tripeptide--D-alanyl-D-alanine ligase [Synergistaceae bacterium]|nr:UDP-N-acetylmuramoyl-tripeptide--D-alanyl-D-alanine ligase [Synergistaceae bacterium]